ncbi:heterogeneous nuclear ribonucleoprotein U-like protein 2 isoform X2 [Xenopus laevis]|uniref:Heterogeneous nuclear ribonucleoprotein U-like protein 2 isoform X2 n=1 Tax=Xenopus laevis TaxID=8355 RepID=A0A8J1KH59_XENLA|nr:heterogeneous nuclear ribonucleoprotein U-like protein 2 isoform X2 [Xenopus laevis]
MSGLDPRRMKVTELRAELQRRGLESRGLKAELCERLQEALDSELLGGDEEKGGIIQDMAGGDEELALDLGEEEDEEEMLHEAQEEEEEDSNPNEMEAAQSNDTGPAATHEGEETGSPAENENKESPPPPAAAAAEPHESDLGLESLNGATSKPHAGDLAAEECAEEEQSSTAESIQIKEEEPDSKSAEPKRHGIKRIREDEQNGRTYHEFKEEAYYSRSKSPVPPEEEDSDIEDSVLCLDKLTCDLQLKMDKDRFGGRPLFFEKFPSLWSGSRATHGVTNGKVYFEVKLTDNLPQKEGCAETPLLRVGWSVGQSSPQLGEDDLSFAYDSRGLKVTSSQFDPYGETFGENDVIGCFADLEGDSVDLFFSKNGDSLGEAFHVEKEVLGDQPLFPHVLCKGCGFQVNFGQKEEAWHPPPDESIFLKDVKAEDLVKSLESTEDCEVFLMIGLPGSGKTTWALKHIQENSEKQYLLMSTDILIPQLKTAGPDPNPEDPKARDRLTKLATQCLIRLIPLAARRKRNYIIDQCTVYNSAQRRKMNCFKDFQRKAVMVVPNEEEWKKRVEQRKEKEGEIIPESVLLEMKANFNIPKKTEYLNEIFYPELDCDEAEALIIAAKKEARQLLPAPDKRGNRMHKRNRPEWGRGGYHSTGNYQQGNYGNRMFMNQPRQQMYHQQQQRSYWAPQRGGYQNYYDQYPSQQNRYYGQYQNYRPQNRGHWQNYEDRTQQWNYQGYRGRR